MALTEYQKMVALSPFRYPLEDLFQVMQILARPEEWSVFGVEINGVLFEMHKAAVTRRLNPPGNFAKLMENVAKNPSDFSKSY